jgi:hypothetical protein
MKILFDEQFYESNYADDGASIPGRLEAIIRQEGNQTQAVFGLNL